MPDYDLKDVVVLPSRNGFSMACRFYINGVYVADFEDKGDGGAPWFCICCDRAALKLAAEFDADLMRMPLVVDNGLSIDTAQCLFIDLLHCALKKGERLSVLE